MLQFRPAPLAAVVALRWVSLFRRPIFAPLPPLAGDTVVVFLFFLSLKVRLALFPFLFAFPVGFVASPFRGVGVGFDETRLRLGFSFVESGFPRFFPYFCR